MKTIRTILATFGMTSLLYGAFALFCVAIDPVFAGRSIYQMFRDTGFPLLVIGIACLLAVIIISFAVAAFRDDPKSRKAAQSEDDESFLENETVPVEEYDADAWTPALKKKSRAALKYEKERTPDLFDEEAPEEEEPQLDESMFRKPKQEKLRRCLFCGTSFPASSPVCPKCGKRA